MASIGIIVVTHEIWWNDRGQIAVRDIFNFDYKDLCDSAPTDCNHYTKALINNDWPNNRYCTYELNLVDNAPNNRQQNTRFFSDSYKLPFDCASGSTSFSSESTCMCSMILINVSCHVDASSSSRNAVIDWMNWNSVGMNRWGTKGNASGSNSPIIIWTSSFSRHVLSWYMVRRVVIRFSIVCVSMCWMIIP